MSVQDEKKPTKHEEAIPMLTHIRVKLEILFLATATTLDDMLPQKGFLDILDPKGRLAYLYRVSQV